MKIIIEIARTELRKLFFSPVAWLVVVIFTLQVGSEFTMYFRDLVRGQKLGMFSHGISANIFTSSSGIYPTVLGYLYLYIPLITMGIMSREFSIGSIKLLYSSPITNTQIILGKFLALVLFAMVMTGLLGVYSVCGIITIDQSDIGLILCGLLGTFLLICTYAAIGLFVSTLTSYMVVAAMGTLGILSLLSFLKRMWQDVAFVRDLTWWISPDGRAETFIKGMITSEDFLYFILVTGMFLALTIVRLNNIRQKNVGWKGGSKYLVVIMIALILGFFSAQPRFKKYVDLTWNKTNTLTKSSQDIIAKLPEGVTITTYDNMLDQNYFYGIPQGRKMDVERFERYLRFDPSIKLNYLYYYHHAFNPQIDSRFPKLTDKQRLDSTMLIYDWDFRVLPYSAVKNQADLSGEKYKFVRVISLPDGKKAFLRIFDDAIRLPNENEITAAFHRLVSPTPVVGFLTGHGEHAIADSSDRGYSVFTKDKTFRYSLLNQGFDVAEVSLRNTVPNQIRILVIPGMRSNLLPAEYENLQEFINRGGNLLILGRPGSQEFMNPITQKLGVTFLPGTLVHPMNSRTQDLIIPDITVAGSKLSYFIDDVAKNGMKITLPRTSALEVSRNSVFKAEPIITSHSDSCWTELQTRDFVNDTARFDPGAGERKGKFPLAVSLTRNVNKTTQKIIITGDADWLSNGELGTERKNIFSGNFNYLYGMIAYLNNGELPVDMRRPAPRDNKINLTTGQWGGISFFLKWLLPLALALIGAMIWFRRKRK